MITLILLYRSFWTDPKPSKSFKDIQRLTLPRRTWRHCFCSGRPDQTELRPQTLLWHVASCGCSSMFVNLDLWRSTVNFHQGPWVHPWTYMNIHEHTSRLSSLALQCVALKGSIMALYNDSIQLRPPCTRAKTLESHSKLSAGSTALFPHVYFIFSPLAAGCTMLYSKGPFSSLAPSKSLPIVQLWLTAAYTAVYLYFLALDVGFMTCFGNSRGTTGTTFDGM